MERVRIATVSVVRRVERTSADRVVASYHVQRTLFILADAHPYDESNGNDAEYQVNDTAKGIIGITTDN